MSFFENSKGWPLVPLINVATLKRGYDLPVGARGDGNIPIFAANGQNGTHNEYKIRSPGVVTGRSGTIGKVHFVEENFWPLNTSLYVTNFHGNDPKWVFYMLSSFKLERFVEGAGVPTLNRNLFHQELIPLPPLPEQKRIAAVLDKADAIRRKRQQAIKLTDDFLRSVFLEMFGDPVTNPKGWEVVNIEDVCSDIVDCINKTAKSVDYETPYKMIRTTNVRDMKVDLTDVRYVDKDVYDKWISRLRPENGDIVFTREAPAGEAGIIDFDDLVFLGQRTMQFRPDKNQVTSSFLLHEMMGAGIKQQMEKMSSGSTVKHLSVPECKKFKVRKPPLDLQIKFERLRSKTMSLLKLENRAGDVSLFESLSQKAFSGNI